MGQWCHHYSVHMFSPVSGIFNNNVVHVGFRLPRNFGSYPHVPNLSYFYYLTYFY